MSTGLAIVVGLFGGLGLFLLGMQLMAEGLQKAAGERMRRILELFTSRPSTAILTGAAVTALLQSSSTTTVMIVGFVNSGLMTLAQAVGTIMGANIGTTITAQIVSFNIYSLALPLIGIGALLFYFAPKRLQKHVGLGLLGFGILLLGLSTMSNSVDPLKSFQPFLDLLIVLGERPFLGILAGTLFTVMVQSSSATTGLVIAFSWQGVISLPAGLSLIVGANLGTCVTVILASFGTSTIAKRAALSHVLFNLFGVILFILLRTPFTHLVTLTGGSVARQIANAHTFFNIFTTLILLPFVPYLVKLVTHLVQGDEELIEQRPLYLDERVLNTPAAALISARRETVRMGELAVTMVEQSVNAFLECDENLLENIEQREEAVNALEKSITAYLAKANQHTMVESHARFLTNLMHVVNDIERMGDHAINIAELARISAKDELRISGEAREDLKHMLEVVLNISRDVLDAMLKHDVAKARSLIAQDELVDELEKTYRTNHIQRLNEGLCHPEIGVLFLDAVSNLERIADHANNIAEAVADIAFAK